MYNYYIYIYTFTLSLLIHPPLLNEGKETCRCENGHTHERCHMSRLSRGKAGSQVGFAAKAVNLRRLQMSPDVEREWKKLCREAFVHVWSGCL